MKYTLEFKSTQVTINRTTVEADSLDDAEELINDFDYEERDVELIESLECHNTIVKIEQKSAKKE